MFLKWTPERGNKQKCKLTMRTLVKLISNFNFTICNWQIDFYRSFEKNFELALVWMSNVCLGIELILPKFLNCAPWLCRYMLTWSLVHSGVKKFLKDLSRNHLVPLCAKYDSTTKNPTVQQLFKPWQYWSHYVNWDFIDKKTSHFHFFQNHWNPWAHAREFLTLNILAIGRVHGEIRNLAPLCGD